MSIFFFSFKGKGIDVLCLNAAYLLNRIVLSNFFDSSSLSGIKVWLLSSKIICKYNLHICKLYVNNLNVNYILHAHYTCVNYTLEIICKLYNFLCYYITYIHYTVYTTR